MNTVRAAAVRAMPPATENLNKEAAQSVAEVAA